MQGALQLQLAGLVALDFFHSVGDDYGDSIDDPMPSVETCRVY